MTSIIAFIWLYADTKDVQEVSELSYGVFWMVIPSLVFFLVLPLLFKKGMNFYTAIALAATITTACYFGFIFLLVKAGIKF